MPVGIFDFISLSQVRAETTNHEVTYRQDILTVLRDSLRDVERLLAKEAQAKEREEQDRQRAQTQLTPLERLYQKAPIMRKIAECESNDRQFDSHGNPLIGFTGADKGRFQINQVHWQRASELGFDINTVQGNAAYAEHLYDRKGTQPWYMSRHCWSN